MTVQDDPEVPRSVHSSVFGFPFQNAFTTGTHNVVAENAIHNNAGEMQPHIAGAVFSRQT